MKFLDDVTQDAFVSVICETKTNVSKPLEKIFQHYVATDSIKVDCSANALFSCVF